MLNNSKRRTLVALSIIPRLGTRKVLKLTKHCEDISEIFRMSKSRLRSFDGVGEATAHSILTFDNWKQVDDIINRTEKIGARILTIEDPEYPMLLKQIYDPPAILWVMGDPAALSLQGIAVIGTRNPSSYGKKMAAKLSTALVGQGYAVFSGLAYGIDAVAHQSAVEAGGKTVAVLGSGIDNLYPRKNAALAKKMIENGGAIITEFPPGTNPDAGNFPIRNRIVSGMSLGVLVVESGLQGGSMITADLALDQNREVFAIPHHLTNVSGSGCNYLIKRGAAKLVQTIDDILEELPGAQPVIQKAEIKKKNLWRGADLDALSQRICETLEDKAHQVDDLADTLHLNTSQLLVSLLQLEMEDIVRQRAGKIFELK